MKQFMTFLFILLFAAVGYSQELKTEYVATTTQSFGKYMKAPVQVYLGDSAKIYIITTSVDRLKNMSYVFAQGIYTQVTGGSTAEADIEALQDSASNYLTYFERLNTRAVHEPDTTYIYKYPLMAVVEYQPSTYPSDTGAHPRTVHLSYGNTVIPDNAIITEVIMDVYSHVKSDDSDATWKFTLDTDGDLTLANIAADSSNEGVYRGWPGIYDLDGNSLSDTLMADSLATHYIKTTAAREILFWTDDTITTGIIRCFVKYVVSSEYSAP